MVRPYCNERAARLQLTEAEGRGRTPRLFGTVLLEKSPEQPGPMNDMEIEKPPCVSSMRGIVDPIGDLLTESFHLLGLFAIGGAAVWAATRAFFEMTMKGHASIEDPLLLFIYLEIGSMVGIYFRTSHMPVRFLLYVSITGLTQNMIGYVQKGAVPDLGILILAGATLILSLDPMEAYRPCESSPGNCCLRYAWGGKANSTVRMCTIHQNSRILPYWDVENSP